MFDFIALLTAIMCGLVTLKALIIGSDFNFITWIKYKKIYTNWYMSRQTFESYINIGQQNES